MEKKESICRECMVKQDFKRTDRGWSMPMRIVNNIRYHLREKTGEKYPYAICSICREKFKITWIPEGSKYDYHKLTFVLK